MVNKLIRRFVVAITIPFIIILFFFDSPSVKAENECDRFLHDDWRLFKKQPRYCQHQCRDCCVMS